MDPKKRQHSPKKRQHTRPLSVSPPEVAHHYRSLPPAELRKLLLDLGPYAAQLPNDLWDRLQHLIGGLIKEAGVPMDEVHRMRWQAVCEAIERVGWDRAPGAAADELANTCAAAGDESMLKSYKKVQAHLPTGNRQRRPWRRRATRVT
jgi:hypothetical protein